MMIITIVCFALAATLECFIRLAAPDRGTGTLPTPLEDFKAGVRFLVADRPALLRLLALVSVLNFLGTGYSAVGFPYTIRAALGFDATVYGISDGLIGIAGIAGAFMAGLIAAKLTMRHFPLTLFAFSLTLIPPIVVFILPANAWTRLIVLVTFTCCMIIASCFANIIAIPTIQMSTPEAMTGKVMSITAALSMCAMPLGQMTYGWAYDRFPVSAILIATTLGIAALAMMMVPLSAQFDD